MKRYTTEEVKAIAAAKDEVVITAKEYWDLLEDARKLQCLENAGIDNCDAYSYAMEEFYGEEQEED